MAQGVIREDKEDRGIEAVCSLGEGGMKWEMTEQGGRHVNRVTERMCSKYREKRSFPIYRIPKQSNQKSPSLPYTSISSTQ